VSNPFRLKLSIPAPNGFDVNESKVLFNTEILSEFENSRFVEVKIDEKISKYILKSIKSCEYRITHGIITEKIKVNNLFLCFKIEYK
jgi:hypothetical protein